MIYKRLDEFNTSIKHPTPCKTCIVRGMCKESCDDFINHLISYLDISKFSEEDQYNIANEVLKENGKLIKGEE